MNERRGIVEVRQMASWGKISMWSKRGHEPTCSKEKYRVKNQLETPAVTATRHPFPHQ
jgi:hypothetical protein